jgi:YHS domain-containing protein
MKRPILTLIALAAAVVVITTAAPGSAHAAKDKINTNWWGVAVKGYDVVAYFTEGKPVKGSTEFEYRWMDAKWRFSSARHLEMFKADPDAYAPMYGGY